LLLALAAPVTLVAQSSIIPVGGRVLPPLTAKKKSELAAKGLLFTEYNSVLPQVASAGSEEEGGFFTLLSFTALTDNPSEVMLLFFDAAGQPMDMPVYQVNPDGSVCLECPPEFVPGVGGVLQPGQSLSQAIRPSGGTARVGYAAFVSDPPVSVAVSGTFAQIVPGRPLFMTGIPPSYSIHRKAFMATLDTNGFTSSMALVAAHGDTSIDLTFRSNFLDVQCSTSFVMANGTHRAFLLRDMLPCIVGQEGAVEIHGVGFAGVGIWSHDQGAFVAQPLVEKLER